MKAILVLASKRVGFETTKFLVESGNPVQSVIVANSADPYNQQLIKFLRSKHIPDEMYAPDALARLISSKNTYAWILNLWSPFILKPEFLRLGKHRLNIHSGLVPGNRGNDNAAWAIRRHEPAGVALLDMEATVDGGGAYVQREVPYDFPTTGAQLHTRLQDEAIRLFIDAWPAIASGELKPKIQQGMTKTNTRKLTETDRVKDAGEKMEIGEMVTWMLAHDFFPGTTAEMRYNGKIYNIRARIAQKK